MDLHITALSLHLDHRGATELALLAALAIVAALVRRWWRDQ